VESAGMAESHWAAQDGRAREMDFASLEDDSLVKRAAMKPGVLSNEDAQKHGVTGQGHGSSFLSQIPATGIVA
jgi:hypothetical protein